MQQVSNSMYHTEICEKNAFAYLRKICHIDLMIALQNGKFLKGIKYFKERKG